MTPSFNLRKVLVPLELLWKFLITLASLLPFVGGGGSEPEIPPEPESVWSNEAVDSYLQALHEAKLQGETLEPPTSYGENVDRWVNMVRKYFREEDVEWAMRVIACESGGNPNAINSVSGATGLFQHLPQYWGHRATQAGFPNAPATDPEANVAASAWLYYEPNYGGAHHWVCK